jgi:hypothetical protein
MCIVDEYGSNWPPEAVRGEACSKQCRALSHREYHENPGSELSNYSRCSRPGNSKSYAKAYSSDPSLNRFLSILCLCYRVNDVYQTLFRESRPCYEFLTTLRAIGKTCLKPANGVYFRRVCRFSLKLDGRVIIKFCYCY